MKTLKNLLIVLTVSITVFGLFAFSQGANKPVDRAVGETEIYPKWPDDSTKIFANPFVKKITVSKDGKSDYKTIQEAINNSSSGTIIEVNGGMYNEHIIMKENISLLGIGNPVINGDSIGVVVIMASNTSISGFTIINSGSESGIDDCGISIRGAKNCFVYNNHIKENGHYGIIIEYSECKIHNNLIENNAVLGIYISNYSVFDFSSNIITEHRHSAFNFGSKNISGVIHNNIVSKNQYGIIYGSSLTKNPDLKVFNNIFYKNVEAIHCPANFANVSYNCFYKNTKRYWDWDADVDVELDSTNIFKDPHIKTIRKFKFYLEESSPCINNGINKTDIGL